MASGIPHILKQRNIHKPPLRFRADGTFHILQLTDIHLVDPEMDDDPDRSIPENNEKNTFFVMESCIRRTQPDLVVLTGDIVNGYWEEMTYDYLHKIIRKVCAIFEKYNVPFAPVFGNHDSELNFHREIQMTLYLESPLCYGTLNAEDMAGCGNYHLPILSGDGTHKAYNLWLMDSNDYNRDANGKFMPGYDYVHEDQIAWYEKTAAALRAENGGEPLPALLFQHIPVQQEYDRIEISDTPAEDVPGFMGKDGTCYSMPAARCGRLRETPCPPGGNHREQFDSWVKTGDIVAAFFGHDHVNDFVVEKDGILLIQTLCAGFSTYGLERGGREIVLREDAPRQIQTESIEILKA